MPAGALRSFCEKTQLCKFHQAGTCTKGTKCGFAHSECELRALPDFRCTRLCPRLISTGECNDASCQFAHAKDQVRRLAVPVRGAQKTPSAKLRAGPAARDGAAGLRQDAFDQDVDCKVSALEELPFERSLSQCPTEASLGGMGSASTGFSRSSTPDDASLDAMILDLSDGESASQHPLSDGESGSGGNAGRYDVGRDDTAGRHPASRNMFHKTKMCIFHKDGRCKRGGLCRFAHDAQELKQTPDLSCTKMCPRVLAGDRCRLDGCAFAHCKEELRGRRRQPAALPAATGLGGRPTNPALASGGSQPSEAEVALPAVPEDCQLCVKNTFIDLEEPQPQELRPRRAHSAPPGLACGTARPAGAEEVKEREQAEEEEQEELPPLRRRRQSHKTWAAAVASPACGPQLPQPQQPLALPPRAAALRMGGAAAVALPRLQ